MKKEIPTNFRKDGFDISLLERQGDVALYVKTRGLYKGYEVMIVRLAGMTCLYMSIL